MGGRAARAARGAASAEARWVAACLRSLSGGAAPVPAGPPPDWDRAVAFAEAHGVAPAVALALRGRAGGVPAAVGERLERCLAESRARHLVLSEELGRVLGRLEREGLPVIPLKGPALAEALYPDPGVRPASDLDLLVRPPDVLAADALLRDLGYHRQADAHGFQFDLAYDHATLYAGPAGVGVDLHWGLLNDPRYVWNAREGLGVWDRAITVRIGGARALALAPEDLLLYLALHLAVHHGLAGLVWYWDLDLLLERCARTLDWPAVVARAARWRVRRALAFALLGLGLVLGAEGPPAVTARLRPRGPRAAALGWLLRHRDERQRRRLERVIALLLVDRGRYLLAPLGRALCPSPAWVRARYEGAGPSLLGHYLAHYRRLAAVVGEAIRIA